MNKLKQLYSSPSAELLVVRFEENIMSPKFNSTHSTEEFLDDIEEDI